MKKLIFVFVALVAMSFVSCGSCAPVQHDTDTTATDSVDTVMVDTVAVDSDSVAVL